MLNAIPKNRFSWDFAVMEGPRHIADIDVAWWREKGVLTVDGTAYNVYREGSFSGAFILESAGSVLARAEKPGVFRRSFIIGHAGREYTLKGKSSFRRDFTLLDGTGEIGSLSPEGFFTRRLKVDLPERLPLPVRVFVIWLAVVLLKREAESAAAS